MYYSITFGEGSNIRNTWDDWHLIPTSRPLVAPPEVKTEYADVFGTDGSLDLTEALSGVNYKDREGEWEFKVENGYQEWNILYTDILHFIHGHNLKVQLESDPEFYYFGRISVSEWLSSESEGFSSVKLKYRLEPYKYRVSTTGSIDWKWDEIQFVNYYVIYYGSFTVENIDVFRNVINPRTISIVPKITCSRPITVSCNGVTSTLSSGTNTSITLTPGNNSMTFKATNQLTNVTIDYDLGETL